ncbi:MAG: hypothetical protein CMJ31_04145 [Phycisphaerae bacterium]|nr:hypothetical protein [Phycisphaerae bacterium]
MVGVEVSGHAVVHMRQFGVAGQAGGHFVEFIVRELVYGLIVADDHHTLFAEARMNVETNGHTAESE